MGYSEKKTLHAAEQEREDVKEKRKVWKAFQQDFDPEKLIFLDECGVNTGMTRLYGRAPKNQRVIDFVPDTRFCSTTVLSSIRLEGTIVPCVFEGALNGKIFVSYIEQFLAPTLKEGDIVIMDNLSSHKVKGVAEAIEKAGAKILYLPPYSPDLNPIEMMWSKVKALLRKAKVRAKEHLSSAIADALRSVALSDIYGWFKHDGYALL